MNKFQSNQINCTGSRKAINLQRAARKEEAFFYFIENSIPVGLRRISNTSLICSKKNVIFIWEKNKSVGAFDLSSIKVNAHILIFLTCLYLLASFNCNCTVYKHI